MQKKIYVVGMFDKASCDKVEASVKAVSGVTSCTANSDKAQVLVDFADESTEVAINAAITSCGIEVVG